MLTDRYGLTVSTRSTAARDAYVEGCDLLLSANPSPVRAFTRAIAADEGFALAHAGLARGLQLAGEYAAAREAMARATALGGGLPAREVSTLAFFALVIGGQGDAAVAAARAHLAQWPRDAMVLSPCTSVFGLIGFSGRAGRERELADLMDGLATHYGDDWWFSTLHAFALMETGQRDAARPKIERALTQNPRSANGAHIRAHMYYEDGEQAASQRFLREWLKDYPRDGQLHCHINWHLALCELGGGNVTEAFRLYADAIRPGASRGQPLIPMVDSVAFLWRAELAGQPRDPAEWQAVHAYAHANFPQAGIAFADTHIALADAVTGDTEGLAARLRQMDSLAAEGRLPSGPVVPALARAFAAFMRQDYAAAISSIEPVMHEHERIGGSRAQRDLVEMTLLKAYSLAGRTDNAVRMLTQRRPGATRPLVAGLPTGVL